MRRATLLIGLTLMNVGGAQAQGLVDWTRLNVTTRVDNDGLAEVAETHEIAFNGDISKIDRNISRGADQSVVVHGVFVLNPDGSKRPLKNAPVVNADSYQVYDWGLQFSLKAEKDPPFERTSRKYVIEYALQNAVTPVWDLAAGEFPLDSHTLVRHPWERAQEVLAGWREGWPELDRRYRFDHDVELPTRRGPDGLPEVNYRFEYDTAWVLLDPNRDSRGAMPDSDYRVRHVLRYVPPGRPNQANVENAAYRVAGLFGPLVAGLLLGLFFLVSDRLMRRGPRGDRALFERLIEPLPAELLAARLGGSATAPSFEGLILRMAAQRRMAVSIEKPATDDTDAEVSLRLTVNRGKLHPVERAVVDGLFGSLDTVSTRDLRDRFRGQEFDPDQLVRQAFGPLRPNTAEGRRPLLRVIHMALTAGGFVLMVKSLTEQTSPDPLVLFAGIAPGTLLAGVWPKASTMKRASIPNLLLAIIAFGSLGAALALIPNTPLSGLAALGLGLMSAGHCVRYLASMPKPSADDLEFEATRNWAVGELNRPRPALRDVWVESLEVLGAGRALAKWKKRTGDFTSAPDMADMGAGNVVAGPPFTGEPPRPPTLPPDWTEGFWLFGDEAGEE